MLCGANKCKHCVGDPCCKTTTGIGLETDGDYEDLKQCPAGFYHVGWKTEIDLFKDQHLRVCKYFGEPPSSTADNPYGTADRWAWFSRLNREVNNCGNTIWDFGSDSLPTGR